MADCEMWINIRDIVGLREDMKEEKDRKNGVKSVGYLLIIFVLILFWYLYEIVFCYIIYIFHRKIGLKLMISS